MQKKLFVSELVKILNKKKFSINTLRHIYGYPRFKIHLYFNPNTKNFFSKPELEKFCRFFELPLDKREILFSLQDKCENETKQGCDLC